MRSKQEQLDEAKTIYHAATRTLAWEVFITQDVHMLAKMRYDTVNIPATQIYYDAVKRIQEDVQ